MYGNTYEYIPVIDEKEYKKKYLSHVVKNYFENSYKDLVSFFAEEKKISTQELQEIIQLIEENSPTPLKGNWNASVRNIKF